MRACRILTVILVLGLGAGQSFAQATTPGAACAADSLYLISPAAIQIDLQEAGRQGMTISWPNLNLDQATCYSLSDTAGLTFIPRVTGGFGDRVDRVLAFTGSLNGAIANLDGPSVQVAWRTEGATTYGSLAGVLNLSNNGGVRRWVATEGRWVPMNDGLPNHWRQANTVAMVVHPGGRGYAAFTSGQTIDSDPQGLFHFDGQTWTRVAADVFTSSRRVTAIAIDPANPDHVAVGTLQSGLFVSQDGGQTFVNWTVELAPDYAPQPDTYRVTAAEWGGGRLLVCLANMGVFMSTDGGQTFSRSPLLVADDLDRANPTLINPLVNAFTFDPNDPQRILASLYYHGVFESNDGGQSWHDLYGDLIVPDPERPGSWLYTAQSVSIDPGDPQTLVAGILQRGIYRTTDGGQTWVKVATDPGLQPGNTGALTRIVIATRPGDAGHFYALEDRWGLLESTDGGATWSFAATQPGLATAQHLKPAADGSADMVIGTWAGGTYVSGAQIALANTYAAGTSDELRNLDLGLLVSFDGGAVMAGSTFRLVCQTFQGWAVWRSPASDPDNMVMVGLYDRVNPEDCIEGYCGDVNYNPVPRCFAAKRAACFDLTSADTLRFFDDEIYNGFSYYYAVTSFDYGNTARTTPENNSNTMLFSRRWDEDTQSPFAGTGNRTYVQANLSASEPAAGDVIYVYPNPLRRDSGVPGEDGRTVIFTNLPPGSRVRVFTTAGDDVANLGPDEQVGGQIRWTTENREREPVAPGVYLYKVEMAARDAFWGKLAIIR